MERPVHNDISPAAIAVELKEVRKTFVQKQPATSAGDLLHPRRKLVTALDGVSFAVLRGEFTAYAGPNGAGKSTTIKLLGGMLTQSAGEVTVLGLSPQKHRVPIMRRLGILFGNRTELWWDHPVSASFRWKRKVWGIPDADFVRMEALVLDLLDIGPFYHTFARELSLGQRMRADLGMMLLHNPELILLDEPTLGLDVLAKRRMIAFLRQLNAEQGTTVIVTSHDMDDLEEMAKRIVLIDSGKVAFDGPFGALRDWIGCGRRAVVRFEDGVEQEYPYQDAQNMLRELSHLRGIADIRFAQTSLEEGLADLYTRWNGTGGKASVK